MPRKGTSSDDLFAHRLQEAVVVELLHAVAEGALARQHHGAGLAHHAGVAGHHGGHADGFQRLLDAAQVARIVIDDDDG